MLNYQNYLHVKYCHGAQQYNQIQLVSLAVLHKCTNVKTSIQQQFSCQKEQFWSANIAKLTLEFKSVKHIVVITLHTTFWSGKIFRQHVFPSPHVPLPFASMQCGGSQTPRTQGWSTESLATERRTQVPIRTHEVRAAQRRAVCDYVTRPKVTSQRL